MKRMLFATMLMVGSAAIAQDTQTDSMTMDENRQDQTPQPGQTTPQQGQAVEQGMPNSADRPAASGAGEGITAEGTNPDGVAIAPPGANVMAMPTPGASVVMTPNQSAVFTTRPATEDYPRCSRTVTDNCVQSGPR